MDRPLKLLMAIAAVALAPATALAQSWPVTVVASAPQMRSPPRAPALSVHRDVIVLRPVGVPPTQPEGRAFRMAARAPADLPQVEVPAKDAWTDDQGFRVGPTKLAFKRRF